MFSINPELIKIQIKHNSIIIGYIYYNPKTNMYFKKNPKNTYLKIINLDDYFEKYQFTKNDCKFYNANTLQQIKI